MAGTKEIKRRIKSVKNTKKITKAMELVAASKMRRSVAQALSSRLYAGYSWELLTSLSTKIEDITHPFFTDRALDSNNHGKTLLVLITSNGSLCGGYNSQIIKKALNMIKEISPRLDLGTNKEQQFPRSNLGGIDIIAVGKKGDDAMRRLGQNVLATFTELPTILSLADIRPLSSLIVTEFKSTTYKEVYVAYTDFISALSQKPNIRKLLPITKQELKDVVESVAEEKKEKQLSKEDETSYLIEGDPNILIESLSEKLVRMQIYQMLLESGASEQSARMVAMKNASEAAGEMIDDLTLVFNKARQAGITQEISEISAGMASVS